MNHFKKYYFCIVLVLLTMMSPVLSGDDYTQNLLKKVVMRNDIAGIENLISEKGANLDEADGTGDTPLIWAVKAGAQKSLQYLIDAKVDVNHQNKFGMTALYHVYQNGRCSIGGIPMAKALLKANAKIDIPETHHGWNIYHQIADSAFDTDLLNVLLQNGNSGSGNISSRYNQGGRRYSSTYSSNIVPAGLNRKDQHGNTPLHLACQRSQPVCIPIVEALLRAGVNVNPRNNNGETPLDVAKLKAVKNILLEHHAHYGKKNTIHNNDNRRRRKIKKGYYYP